MDSCTEKNRTSCQMHKNIALLSEIEVFAKIPPHIIKVIALLCRRVCLNEGEVLFNKGDDPAQAVHIITGKFLMEHSSEEHFFVEAGELVGTLSLCSSFPSLFSMVAEEKSEILILDRTNFTKIVEQFPSVLQIIAEEAVAQVYKWDSKQCKKDSVSRPFGGVSSL